MLTDTAKAASNMAAVGPKAIATSTAKKAAVNLVIKDGEQRATAVPEITMVGHDQDGPEDLNGVVASMQNMLQGGSSGAGSSSHDREDHPGKSTVTIEEMPQ